MLKKLFFLFLILLLAVSLAGADVIQIKGTDNVDDAKLAAVAGSNRNYGVTTTLAVNTTINYMVNRVKNLSSLLPANATISSCICSLYCVTNSIDDTIYTDRVFKPWVEGDEDGTDNDDGDVTYNDWTSDANEWGTEGCLCADDNGVDNNADDGDCEAALADRKTTPESKTFVSTVDTWYGFSVSSALAQAWYNGTATENGVILIGNHLTNGSNTFASSEYTTDTSKVPFWTITYTIPHAPVLASIGAQTDVQHGIEYSLRVSATDADADSIILSIEDEPYNAVFVDSFNGAGSFVWTPTFDQAWKDIFEDSVYSVLFIASDGTLADSELVIFTVTNTPPVLDSIPDSTVVMVGEEVSWCIYGTDANNDSIILNISGEPYGATFFDSGNGVGLFTYTPTMSQKDSTYRFGFGITDQLGGGYSRSTRIDVILTPTDTAMVCAPDCAPTMATKYPIGDRTVGSCYPYPASPTTRFDKVDDPTVHDGHATLDSILDSYITMSYHMTTLNLPPTVVIDSMVAFYAESTTNHLYCGLQAQFFFRETPPYGGWCSKDENGNSTTHNLSEIWTTYRWKILGCWFNPPRVWNYANIDSITQFGIKTLSYYPVFESRMVINVYYNTIGGTAIHRHSIVQDEDGKGIIEGGIAR